MSNSTHLLVPARLEVCNGPSAVYVTNVGLQNLCHLCQLNFLHFENLKFKLFKAQCFSCKNDH